MDEEILITDLKDLSHQSKVTFYFCVLRNNRIALNSRFSYKVIGKNLDERDLFEFLFPAILGKIFALVLVGDLVLLYARWRNLLDKENPWTVDLILQRFVLPVNFWFYESLDIFLSFFFSLRWETPWRLPSRKSLGISCYLVFRDKTSLKSR